MNTKFINACCFLLPFIGTVFNVQAFGRLYFSLTVSQAIAYGFIALLIIGIIINIKKSGKFSKTAGLWIAFYIFYYVFATLASTIHNNTANILASIIPVIYMLAFYVYLSFPQNRKLFEKVALVSFVLSAMLCIYLFRINWSLDYEGIHKYNVDRAGGVFGDANNAALVAIISFVFVYKKYKPTKTIWKYFRVLLLLLMFYNLAITFSTTGYAVFIIAFILLNYKFFTPKRMVLSIILIPFFYFTLINLNDLVSGLDLTTPQRDKINNIVNILTLNTAEIDDSGRDYLLDNLFGHVYENPIIGNGIDFTVSIKGHNTLVGVWADAGIFTLIIFLFLLGNYFKKAVKSLPHIRYFVLPILLAMFVFMLSLQTVINQGYIMALFVYIGYLLDDTTNPILKVT